MAGTGGGVCGRGRWMAGAADQQGGEGSSSNRIFDTRIVLTWPTALLTVALATWYSQRVPFQHTLP